MLICTYRLSVKNIVGRSKGQSVVNSAAYISRTKLKDFEINKTFDYSKNKSPAIATKIIVPDISPSWAIDAEQLWNAVQKAEYKNKAQFARPLELNLPHQLSTDEMFEILQDFSKQAFVSQGMIAHVALHLPDVDNGGDNRNYHAHILLTLRRVNEQGFCGNKVREWNKKSLLKEWRESWAIVCADKLRSLGFEQEAERWRHGYLTLKQQYKKAIERGDIDYAEQACNHEPTRHKGTTICALERKGIASYVMQDREDEKLAAEKERSELMNKLEKDIVTLNDEIQIEEILYDYSNDLDDDYHRERTR